MDVPVHQTQRICDCYRLDGACSRLAPKPPQFLFFPITSICDPFQLPQLAPKLGTSETGYEALSDPQHGIQSHKNHKALSRRDALPRDKWKRYRDCKLGIKCWYGGVDKSRAWVPALAENAVPRKHCQQKASQTGRAHKAIVLTVVVMFLSHPDDSQIMWQRPLRPCRPGLRARLCAPFQRSHGPA